MMTQDSVAPARALPPHRLVRHPAIDLIGIEARFTPQDSPRIAQQWRHFMTRHVEIANAAPQPPLACAHLHPDASFDYLCAVQVTEPSPPPEGMVLRCLPEAAYAVFRHAGPLSTIRQTMQAILDPWVLPRPLARPPFVLELFLQQFDPATGEGGVDIWVALAPAGQSGLAFPAAGC